MNLNIQTKPWPHVWCSSRGSVGVAWENLISLLRAENVFTLEQPRQAERRLQPQQHSTPTGYSTKCGMHYGSDKSWGQSHKQTHKFATDRHGDVRRDRQAPFCHCSRFFFTLHQHFLNQCSISATVLLSAPSSLFKDTVTLTPCCWDRPCRCSFTLGYCLEHVSCY